MTGGWTEYVTYKNTDSINKVCNFLLLFEIRLYAILNIFLTYVVVYVICRRDNGIIKFGKELNEG